MSITPKILAMYRKYILRTPAIDPAVVAKDIFANRQKVIKFRDILDDDVVKLERDFLLSLRMLKYGTEYTLDLALERELNYHQGHAQQEMKMTHGKAMEGLPYLNDCGIPLPALSELRSFDGDKEAAFSYRSITKPTILHIIPMAASPMENIAKWKVPNGMDVVVMYNSHTFSVKALETQLVKAYRKALPAPIHNCYYGRHLLRSFMPTFDIRNFYLNYVMLVDHTGHARWMSSWTPTEGETLLMPSLCDQLLIDHIRHLAK